MKSNEEGRRNISQMTRLRNKEHKVNALVIRAEEGRGKLRKAMIRSKHPIVVIDLRMRKLT